MTRRQVSRRGFLGGAAALGAAGLVRPADGAAGHNGHRVDERLPRRGDFTIRGAYVMSMDPEIGDLPDADVHVRGARDRGRGPRAAGAGRDDRRARHDRDAGADRHPLAHVDDALPVARLLVAGERVLRPQPAHGRCTRAPRRGARRAAGRRRRAHERDHHRARLGAQHPRAGVCGRRPARARAFGPPRPLLLRRAAGTSRRPADRPRRLAPRATRVVRERARRAAGPRHRRTPAGRDRSRRARAPPARVPDGARARPAGQLPCELQPRARAARDDPAARGRGNARPADAGDPRALHNRRGAQRTGRDRDVGQLEPMVRAADRLRRHNGARVGRRRRSREPLRRHAAADRHGGHVLDHPRRAGIAPRTVGERVLDQRAADDRGGDDRCRARARRRRRHRLAHARQARRSHHGPDRRRQHRAVHRRAQHDRDGRAAGQRRHRRGRRPHPQASRTPDRNRHRARRRRGGGRARGAARASRHACRRERAPRTPSPAAAERCGCATSSTSAVPLERTWETLLDVPRVARALPGATIDPDAEGGAWRGHDEGQARAGDDGVRGHRAPAGRRRGRPRRQLPRRGPRGARAGQRRGDDHDAARGDGRRARGSSWRPTCRSPAARRSSAAG